MSGALWYEREVATHLGVVVSNRSAVEDWLDRVTRGLCNGVSGDAVKILRSSNLELTTGLDYNVHVVRGEGLHDHFTTEDVEVSVKGGLAGKVLAVPPLELAPLLRWSVTDEILRAMDLESIVVMHNPAFGLRLSVERRHGLHMVAYDTDPLHTWQPRTGFAYVSVD